MMNELSAELREYLKCCGMSANEIARCNASTRMYHDLGLYGDIAEGYMEVLAKQYRVDLSGFEFERFFPLEFAGRNAFTRTLLWIVPFAGSAARRRGEWAPLSLERIDRALRSRRWE